MKQADGMGGGEERDPRCSMGWCGRARVGLLITVATLSGQALAQSDPSNFDTVINVPGDMPSITGEIGSNTQLNLYQDGEVNWGFGLGPSDGTGSNIELNIYGGQVNYGANFYAGSTTNLIGGSTSELVVHENAVLNVVSGRLNVGGSFYGKGVHIKSGGLLNIMGGKIGNKLITSSGTLVVHGTEFFVGYNEVNDPVESMYQYDSFGATLPDGNLLILHNDYLLSPSDRIIQVELVQVPLPPADPTPVVLPPGFHDLMGLRPGQTLTINEGVTVGTGFTAVDAVINLEGGSIGNYAQIVLSEMNITDGTIGHTFGAFAASTVNVTGGNLGSVYVCTSSVLNMSAGRISPLEVSYGGEANITGGEIGESLDVNKNGTLNLMGGFVDRYAEAFYRSEVNISGGTVYLDFQALSGSEINISGGTIWYRFTAHSGSTVNLSGGSIGLFFNHYPNADLQITGTDFRMNGEPVIELPELFFDSDDLTGILADGTPFVFSPGFGDELSLPDVALVSVSLQPADIEPMVISEGSGPSGLRPGQTLTLRDGGEIGDFFTAIGSTLNIEGGTVGQGIELVDTNFNITGGTFDDFIHVLRSEVHVVGADMSSNFYMKARGASRVRVEQGSVMTNLTLHDGAELILENSSVNQADIGPGCQGSFTNFESGKIYLGTDGVLGMPAVVNLDHGQTSSIQLYDDCELNIFDTAVNGYVFTRSGCTVNLHSGSIGSRVSMGANSVFSVYSGMLGGSLSITSGSVAEISGGEFSQEVQVYSGGTLLLTGSSFTLDGQRVNNLGHGETIRVHDRDAELRGVLADGSEFVINLNSVLKSGLDFADPDASIQLRFVDPICPADVNGDSFLDLGDIGIFVDLFLASDLAADINGDGILDIGDISEFVSAFLAGC